MSIRSGSIGTPALPAAAIRRPQLASSPKRAVLTRGDVEMVLAMVCASWLDMAPLTIISTHLLAPSPSFTRLLARLLSTCSSRTWNSPACSRLSMETLDCPLASISVVSLVLVSPSIQILLSVLFTPDTSSFCNRSWGMDMSVHMKHSMVAILGAIIPEPLAIPTRL